MRESYKNDLFYTTSDSSLNNGFEAHTHPATHKTHVSRKWRGFAFLRNEGAKSYDTDTSGLHFHLNRSAFSHFHLLKFLMFIMDNIAFSLAVGRRKNVHNLNEYAHFEFRFIHDLKRMIKSKFNTSSYKEEIKTRGYSYPTMTSGSRGAINLRNRKTIELRFMGGSLQEKYYKSKVDYIQAVYEYTFNSSFSSQNIREFVRYIKRNKNRFKNLHDVLDSKT